MSYYDKLLPSILKRSESLFKEDIESRKGILNEKIKDSSILVLGAAGSIGSAVVKALIPYGPKKLHLVDLSENGLVEVIRDLRSSSQKLPEDLKTYALDIFSEEFKDFLYQNILPSGKCMYDSVLNFAALKHFRSEKDPYTLRRMFKTNTNTSFSTYWGNYSDINIFSVSSDKAVKPTSLMGATKQLMEHLYYWQFGNKFSTTRFANVAFSAGSLLDGFKYRVEKQQPLFVPEDVTRYFISHEEASQLCLLSAFCSKGEILVPKIPKDQLVNFKDIADIYIRKHLKLIPRHFSASFYNNNVEEVEALLPNSLYYPVVLNKTDTSGEKLYEEFYTENDTVDFSQYKNIGVLKLPDVYGNEITGDFYGELLKLKTCSRKEYMEILSKIVIGFQHVSSAKNLDERA